MVDLTANEFDPDFGSSPTTTNVIAAFSTRNLFKHKNNNINTEANNDVVDEKHSSLSPPQGNNDEKSFIPAITLNTKKRLAQTTSEQIKQEFKPHILKMAQQQQQQQNVQQQKKQDQPGGFTGEFIKIKKIIKANSLNTTDLRPESGLISKSEARIGDLHSSGKNSSHKSELTSKSSYQLLMNTIEEKKIVDDSQTRHLNKIAEEKEIRLIETAGLKKKSNNTQIPSKYSSFTDLTKNKPNQTPPQPTSQVQNQTNNQQHHQATAPNSSLFRDMTVKNINKIIVQQKQPPQQQAHQFIGANRNLADLNDIYSLKLPTILNQTPMPSLNNNQMKKVNTVNDYFNSILDYNSFNLNAYQLNSSMNEFYPPEPQQQALPFASLKYAGANYSGLNLSGGSSGTATTSSVSTNSSSLASSSGVNMVKSDGVVIVGGGEKAKMIADASESCFYEPNGGYFRNYTVNFSKLNLNSN